MKRLFYFLFGVVFLCTPMLLIAQLYKVDLEQRITASELLIEGKVMQQTTFRGADDHIYTASTVQPLSILKGELNAEVPITLITNGGTLGDEVETWTHLLTLKPNDIGVFFLIPNTRPTPPEQPDLVAYEVYSSSQGFLKYSEGIAQNTIATAPFNYFDRQDLLQTLQETTGQFTPVQFPPQGSEDRSEIRYRIKNVVLQGGTLDFDIYVEGLWGSYELTRSEMFIEYDASVLGNNVQSNGILTVAKGTVSNSPNYQLNVSDVNPNRVGIKLEALNTGFGLYTITNLEEQLVHITINSPLSIG